MLSMVPVPNRYMFHNNSQCNNDVCYIQTYNCDVCILINNKRMNTIYIHKLKHHVLMMYREIYVLS